MVKLDCGANCARIILFVFNFLFWLLGLALIGVGIWMKADPYVVSQFLVVRMEPGDGFLNVCVAIMITVGCFMTVMGFLGCCGAIRLSPCMLSMYAAALILILCLQICVGVIAFIFRNRIEYSLRGSMMDQIKNEYMFDNNIGKAWNFVQVRFRCCGSTGPKDYDNSKWQEANTDEVPKTCCILTHRQDRDLNNVDPQAATPRDFLKCQNDAQGHFKTSLYVHGGGCYLTILEFVKRNATILIGFGLGVALLQLVGLACAVVLVIAIRREKRDGK